MQHNIRILLKEAKNRFNETFFDNRIRVTNSNDIASAENEAHIVHEMLMVVCVLRDAHNHPPINGGVSPERFAFPETLFDLKGTSVAILYPKHFICFSGNGLAI